MGTFAKGAIATVTAAALTAGLYTTASAQDDEDARYSTTFKNNVCTFISRESDGYVSKWDRTVEESKVQVKLYQQSIDRTQREIAELTKKKAETSSLKEKAAIQKEIAKKKRDIYEYLRIKVAFQGCAEGKSLNSSSIDSKALLSSPDGESLSEVGIGVVVAGVLVAVLGAVVAALPMIKPMLPPEIAALLP